MPQSRKLLTGIANCLKEFAHSFDYQKAAEVLLDSILEFSGSSFGYIALVHYDEKGAPYLRSNVLSNIAWNEETRALYEASMTAGGVEFHNLNTLFGAALLSGKPMIANQPASHPAAGGTPKGHPPLNAFLALPINRAATLIGQLAIANKPGGYTEKDIEDLGPALSVAALLIEGTRLSEGYRSAQAEIVSSGRALHRSQMDFISQASHEFRTPLAVILSSTDLIEIRNDGSARQDISRHLDTIRKSVGAMTRLLEDILVLGKMEGGNLLTQKSPTDVLALTQVCIATFGLDGERCVVSTTGVAELVLLDDLLFRQIVENLVSNALKYSPTDAAVHISLQFTPATLLLEVKDDGIGIPPDVLQKIGDPFLRASSSSRTYPGTGLGMTVVKSCIERLNGKMDIKSKVGFGTTITVSFPRYGSGHGKG